MLNSTLNSRAAEEADIAGEFRLENFTYTSASILNLLSGHLSNTDFLGITVRLTCFCNITTLVRRLSRPVPALAPEKKKRIHVYISISVYVTWDVKHSFTS